MKKVLSCLFVVALLVALSTSALAVSSVQNAGAPELISAVDANGNDISDKMIITPYDEDDTLPDEMKEDIEEAYALLQETEDLTTLSDALAGDRAVAISELFNIRFTEPVDFPVHVILRDLNLDNFAAFMFYNAGAFENLDSEIVNGNLESDISSEGTYAVFAFVDDAASPATGETVPYGTIIGAVILVGAAVWFFTKSRKVNA
jgi:LPXTG-motif cell wall-anchored protein